MCPQIVKSAATILVGLCCLVVIFVFVMNAYMKGERATREIASRRRVNGERANGERSTRERANGERANRNSLAAPGVFDHARAQTRNVSMVAQRRQKSGNVNMRDDPTAKKAVTFSDDKNTKIMSVKAERVKKLTTVDRKQQTASTLKPSQNTSAKLSTVVKNENKKKDIRQPDSNSTSQQHINTHSTRSSIRNGRKTDSTGISNGTNPHRQKYLIYLCDGRRPCAGWGDRQRGLVSTFLIAYVTGRRFGINMTNPCNLNRFYQPNQVAWNVTESDIQNKSVRFIDSMDAKGAFHGNLLKVDVDEAYPEDVIFVRTNVEHFWSVRGNPHYKKKLPPLALHGRPWFFKEAWSMLMKPTQHLQDHAEDFLRQCRYFNRTKPFVCAHVRIGVSKYNPKDTEKRNDVNKLGALWDFLQAYVSNGSDVFLATDNPDVREMSRKKFGSAHHDTGGVILHVDKTRGDRDQERACLGFEYALLDQHVLTQCDVLVTSNSMFSARAALIRGTVENLFHFANGNVTKVTRL
ncbi:uncharacterized protein [Littorina saxatilis]|uniref:Uncharacterized protein n=1 Tax=Littorina saxatilis TaxID=31220 RepID=A0AAN9AM05_9CAEN